MRRRDVLLLGATLLALAACTPPLARPPTTDAVVTSYLRALFADGARGFGAAATPAAAPAQGEGGEQYRGLTVLEGPTITGGPLPGQAPATTEYTAVVRARAASGLDYQFDFTVVVDAHSHRVTGSTARRSVLEPRPCCE